MQLQWQYKLNTTFTIHLSTYFQFCLLKTTGKEFLNTSFLMYFIALYLSHNKYDAD